MKNMGKVTRYTSRVVLRYLGEKSNTKNRTSYNHINHIWENIYKDFDEKVNLNQQLENLLDPVLTGRAGHRHNIG